MESFLVWGLALVAATVILMILEIFIPSGGIIATFATLCGVSGVVCLFFHDWRIALSAAGGLVLLIPLALAFAFHVMPSTPMGRKLIHQSSVLPEEGAEPEQFDDAAAHAASQVGAEGVVMTDLRPIGSVRIGQERFEARSEIGYVAAGAKVKVVRAEGKVLTVRSV